MHGQTTLIVYSTSGNSAHAQVDTTYNWIQIVGPLA